MGENLEITSKGYLSLLLKNAIACDCNAIILAHNHPGGSTLFSKEDKALTQRLIDIFHPLDIKILDHIIVANMSYYSMAEKGEIPYHCIGKANYEAMVLAETDIKEKLYCLQCIYVDNTIKMIHLP